MAFYAHLSGNRVTAARILLPAWGAWSGDVMLADDSAVTSPATLTIGNLVLVGSAYRGTGPESPFAGSRSVRLVAGGGGWRKDVTRRFYADQTQVKLSTVAKDAASEVGEVVVVPSDRLLGPHWAREAAPASRCLTMLVGREGWYVSHAGVTVLAERTASKVTTEFRVISYDGGKGHLSIATEDPLAWTPGAVFQNEQLPAPLTVTSATVAMMGDGKMRVEVMTA